MRITKTPTQMRREAEGAKQPRRPAPAAPVDPAKYPRLHSDGNSDDETCPEHGRRIAATREWLACTCPEPAEGSPPAASLS
jgi:hypothetical protein